MLTIECDIPCLPSVGFSNVWKKTERVPLHPIILRLVAHVPAQLSNNLCTKRAKHNNLVCVPRRVYITPVYTPLLFS